MDNLTVSKKFLLGWMKLILKNDIKDIINMEIEMDKEKFEKLLYDSLEEGNFESFKSLLTAENKKYLLAKSSFSSTSVYMHALVKTQDLAKRDVLKFFKELLPWGDVNTPIREGITILHKMNSPHKKDELLLLLKYHPKIDCQTERSGTTPLMSSCTSNKNLEIVKIYLQNGANPNIVSFEGDTCLIRAVLNQAEEIVEELINHGAEIFHDCRGKHFIEYCLEQDNTNLIKIVMKKIDSKEDILKISTILNSFSESETKNYANNLLNKIELKVNMNNTLKINEDKKPTRKI